MKKCLLTRTLLWLLVGTMIIGGGCSNQEEKKYDPQASTTYYPNSIGAIDQVLFVTDSSAWQSGVKALVDDLFGAPYAILPQPEPIFDIKYRPYHSFKDLFKKYRNIVFIGIDQSDYNRTLDYVKDLLPQSKFHAPTAEKPFRFYSAQTIWAKPQQVTFLLARSVKTLQQGFQHNNEQLIQHIQSFETKELRDRIAHQPKDKGIIDTLRKLYFMELPVPRTFQVAMDKPHFLWLRHMEKKVDLNIVINTKPYTDTAAFKMDHIIRRRNRVLGKYIKGEVKNSYMKTDTVRPVLYKRENVNGMFAVKTKGLWRLANDFMGGPFVNYTIYDKKNNRLITLDGFVYAPGESKRKHIRRLEVILESLKVVPMGEST